MSQVWRINAGPSEDPLHLHMLQTTSQSFPLRTRRGKCVYSAPGAKLWQPPRIQVPFPAARPTSHVLIQGQGHSHITDLDGFKVTFNDHV